MDNRCPICASGLGRRKLSQAIVARMEIDCPHCKGRLRLNLHQLEFGLLLSTFAGFLALAVLAHRLQSQALLLTALACGLAGILALHGLERSWLRDWPRYVPVTPRRETSP